MKSPALLLATLLAVSPLALAHHDGGDKAHAPCDVNGDGVVTRSDIDSIKRAVQTPGDTARGKDDPRDINHDGHVTKRDLNACVQKCTYKSCGAK